MNFRTSKGIFESDAVFQIKNSLKCGGNEGDEIGFIYGIVETSMNVEVRLGKLFFFVNNKGLLEDLEKF